MQLPYFVNWEKKIPNSVVDVMKLKGTANDKYCI